MTIPHGHHLIGFGLVHTEHEETDDAFEAILKPHSDSNQHGQMDEKDVATMKSNVNRTALTDITITSYRGMLGHRTKNKKDGVLAPSFRL
jgi:hypothetical protein